MDRRSFVKLFGAIVPFITGGPLISKASNARMEAKEYTVLLEQYVDRPLLVTNIKNTLGNAVWSRVGPAVYDLTLAGAFPLDKTYIPTVWHCDPGVIVVLAYRQDENRVRLWVKDWNGNPLEDAISAMPFKIEVYP